MYKIENDIPLVPGQYVRYPWGLMRHGDSFLVPWIEDKPQVVVENRVRSAVTARNKRQPDWPYRFYAVKQPDGMRVCCEAREPERSGAEPNSKANPKENSDGA